MRIRLASVAGLLLVIGWASIAQSGQPSRAILVLGNAAFLNDASVQ